MWSGDVAQWYSACLACTRPWAPPTFQKEKRAMLSSYIEHFFLKLYYFTSLIKIKVGLGKVLKILLKFIWKNKP
jgi:hypothetical protein